MVLDGTREKQCIKLEPFSKSHVENKAVWFRNTVTKLTVIHRTLHKKQTIRNQRRKQRQVSAQLSVATNTHTHTESPMGQKDGCPCLQLLLMA